MAERVCRTCGKSDTETYFEVDRRVCNACRCKSKSEQARRKREQRGLKSPGPKPGCKLTEKHKAAIIASRREWEATGMTKEQRDLATYRPYFTSEEAFKRAVEKHRQLLSMKCPNRAWRVIRNQDEAGIRV